MVWQKFHLLSFVENLSDSIFGRLPKCKFSVVFEYEKKWLSKMYTSTLPNLSITSSMKIECSLKWAFVLKSKNIYAIAWSLPLFIHTTGQINTVFLHKFRRDMVFTFTSKYIIGYDRAAYATTQQLGGYDYTLFIAIQA